MASPVWWAGLCHRGSVPQTCRKRAKNGPTWAAPGVGQRHSVTLSPEQYPSDHPHRDRCWTQRGRPLTQYCQTLTHALRGIHSAPARWFDKRHWATSSSPPWRRVPPCAAVCRRVPPCTAVRRRAPRAVTQRPAVRGARYQRPWRHRARYRRRRAPIDERLASRTVMALSDGDKSFITPIMTKCLHLSQQKPS